MKKGISKSKVIEISKLKNEPKWMRDFRIKSYEKFLELPNPIFGPELKIRNNRSRTKIFSWCRRTV